MQGDSTSLVARHAHVPTLAGVATNPSCHVISADVESKTPVARMPDR
jgi:hypothetical protein